MKVFSVLLPHTLGFLDLLVEELGIDHEKFDNELHPQEDFLRVSEKYPVFAVADGVTLEVGDDGRYPNPSGAGAVAEIFCNEIVREAEKLYFTFTHDNVGQIFRKANGFVGRYNTKRGRTRESLNFLDFDLFAATAAFGILKDDVFYWASVCDSYVGQYGRDGELKFRSPACWSPPRIVMHSESEWRAMNEAEQKKELRRVYRNGLDEKKNPIGYGVVTGEKAAERYLKSGSFRAGAGDLILLYTDGFEHYVELPEFIVLFCRWPDDLERRVRDFCEEKAQEDIPKYGRERTLIAVLV